ncbi:MAG: NAD(P)-binding domain-containing protein [Lachnospiraceae bacterium]|nr:NAD(P)-binding domain-containing protein [Lachnospiraceae bacterium]
MKKIGICGGDVRNAYLAGLLSAKDCEVWIWDLDAAKDSLWENRIEEAQGRLAKLHGAESFEALAEQVDVLIGATPLFRYALPGTTAEETAERFLRLSKEGRYFFAGGIPSSWITRAKNAGAVWTDFLRDTRYQELNARLTAEGTLAEMLLCAVGGLAGNSVLVSGYGSCGKAIAKQLQANGAEVTVCVRRIESAREAAEAGLKVCYFEYVEKLLQEFDFVINTVPAGVFGKECIKQLRKDSRLLEIASGAGGFDMDAIQESGLQVKRCPGLPGKYAPLCCARGMLELVEQVLMENG